MGDTQNRYVWMKRVIFVMIVELYRCVTPPPYSVSAPLDNIYEINLPSSVSVVVYESFPAFGRNLMFTSITAATTDGLRLYDTRGQLLTQITAAAETRSIPIKNSALTLSVSNINIPDKQFFGIQYLGGQFSLNLLFKTTAGLTGIRAIDSPTDNYIVFARVNVVWRIDITTQTESTAVALAESTKTLDNIVYKPSTDSFIICKQQTGLPNIRRSDLSAIQNYKFNFYGTFGRFTMDNLADKYLFVARDMGMFSAVNTDVYDGFQITTSGSADFMMYGGWSNNLINVGTFQYLVTVPSNVLPSKAVFYCKPTFTCTYSNYILSNTYKYTSAISAFGTLTFEDPEEYYMSILFVSTSASLHLYKIKMDNCTAVRTSDVCTACPAGTYKTNSTVRNRCLHPSNFPPLHGIDLPNLSIQQCLDPYCIACTSDYKVCVQCQQNMRLETDKCVAVEGFGKNHDLIQVQACMSMGCIDCAEYYKECQKCTDGAILNNTIWCSPTAGFGPNWSANTISKCASLSCQACLSDVEICTRCEETSSYLSNERCLPKPGFGIAPSSKNYEACTVEGCSNCSAKYSICTECNWSKGFILDNSKCSKEQGKLALYFTEYRDGKVYITFEEDINALLFDPLKFEYILVDTLKSQNRSMVVGKDLSVQTQKNQLIVVFESDLKLTDGFLSIHNTTINQIHNNLNTKCYSDFPITTFNLHQSYSYISSIISVFIFVCRLALMNKHPHLSSIMIASTSSIFYLGLMNTPYTSLPSIFFQIIGHTSLLPVHIGNPLYETDTCAVNHSTYLMRGLRCNLLYNYGGNLICIYSIALFSILVSSLSSYLRKIVKQEKLLRLVSILDGVLGLRYFFTLMDGVEAQLFTLMFLHFSTSSFYFMQTIATILCAKFLLYYAVTVYFKQKACLNIFSAIKAEGGGPKMLGKFHEKHPYFFYDSLLHETGPLNLLGKYYTSIRTLKNLVVSTVVVFSMSVPSLQLMAVLSIESIHLYTLLASKLRLQASFVGLNIMYLCLAVITLSFGINSNAYQSYLAGFMLVVLVLILSLSIGFSIYSIASSVFLHFRPKSKVQSSTSKNIAKSSSGSGGEAEPWKPAESERGGVLSYDPTDPRTVQESEGVFFGNQAEKVQEKLRVGRSIPVYPMKEKQNKIKLNQVFHHAPSMKAEKANAAEETPNVNDAKRGSPILRSKTISKEVHLPHLDN